MGVYRVLTWAAVGFAVAACTSDPDATINQTTPIRQMDRFFDRLSGREAPPPQYVPPPSQYVPPPREYSRSPGYAPAYPPYEYRR